MHRFIDIAMQHANAQCRKHHAQCIMQMHDPQFQLIPMHNAEHFATLHQCIQQTMHPSSMQDIAQCNATLLTPKTQANIPFTACHCIGTHW